MLYSPRHVTILRNMLGIEQRPEFNNEQPLEKAIHELLLQHHLTLATAESSDGGLIAHVLPIILEVQVILWEVS